MHTLDHASIGVNKNFQPPPPITLSCLPAFPQNSFHNDKFLPLKSCQQSDNENPFDEHYRAPLSDSGRVPFLACQDVQKSGNPSVRYIPGHVVKTNYGHDREGNELYALEYACPEIQVPYETTSYRQKVKISGNALKVRNYEKPQTKGYKQEKANDEKTVKERTPEEIARQAIANGNRAKDKLIDLVNSVWGMCSRQNFEGNMSVKFLTLTYKECMDNLSRAHDDFVRFLDRLEYVLKQKIEYIGAPEKQARGAWHIHLLLYCNFIPLQWLLDNWNAENGQGSFDIQQIELVNNLGMYVAKYIEKTFLEEGVLPGHHRYWHSEGLKDRSVTLYLRQPAFRLLDFIEYFAGYIATKKNGDPAMRMGHYGEGNEYTGRVDFLDITLKPCPEVKELLKTLKSWLGTA
jgi:hypothetical protein